MWLGNGARVIGVMEEARVTSVVEATWETVVVKRPGWPL